MDRPPADNFPARSAPASRNRACTATRSKEFAPPTQPWDVITSSLLRELDERLGSMRQSWLAAEVSRLRALSDAASAASTSAADRVQLLRQLADLEPSMLEGDAEIASLLEKCEAIIQRCTPTSESLRNTQQRDRAG